MEKDCWIEEVNVLHEEFDWTICYFSRMAMVWEELGSIHQNKLKGAQAYASKTAHMYCVLKENCVLAFVHVLNLELYQGSEKYDSTEVII